MPNPENVQPHKFPKGQSGNPKGRPKKIPALDKLLENIPENQYQAIMDKLAEKARRGDVRAAEVLLDRAYGKAKQPIAQDSNVTVTIKHES